MARNEPAGNQASIQNQEVFHHELAILTSDHDPEVRAIAAEVIAHLEITAASPALRRVLQDSQWFVRRGALRVLTGRPGLLPIAEVKGFLTDPHRKVRQAALRVLLANGREGISTLYEHFLRTQDEILKEEIIEEVEHSGLVLNLLQSYGDSQGNLETRVVEQFVTMGATRYLHAVLSKGPGRQFRQVLSEKLRGHPEQKIAAWGRLCGALDTAREPDQTDYCRNDLAA